MSKFKKKKMYKNMCFSCEWCMEIKNRPLVADDY